MLADTTPLVDYMNRLSQLINRIAPATKAKPETQLALFPAHELYCVPPTPAKTVRLPKSVLLINPDEELSDYLSRVAAAAMAAATKAYGTPAKAAIRLGTIDSLIEEEPATPKLRLASSDS